MQSHETQSSDMLPLEKTPEQCNICQMAYSNITSNMVTLPCAHSFHFTCMCQWMSRCGIAESTCPTCRAKVCESVALPETKPTSQTIIIRRSFQEDPMDIKLKIMHAKGKIARYINLLENHPNCTTEHLICIDQLWSLCDWYLSVLEMQPITETFRNEWSNKTDYQLTTHVILTMLRVFFATNIRDIFDTKEQKYWLRGVKIEELKTIIASYEHFAGGALAEEISGGVIPVVTFDASAVQPTLSSKKTCWRFLDKKWFVRLCAFRPQLYNAMKWMSNLTLENNMVQFSLVKELKSMIAHFHRNWDLYKNVFLPTLEDV